jgi:sulfatase maturation enzyme AslB (radical SAM superfamily)
MTINWETGVFHGVIPLGGFYEIERDNNGPFVWARASFMVRTVSSENRFAVEMCTYSEEGKLSVYSGDQLRLSIALCRGWHTYALDFSDFDTPEISFELNGVSRIPGDPRELGIMIRTFEAIIDGEAFDGLRASSENRMQNNAELVSGKDMLESLPPRLRISVETRCNVLPRCIYCEWEWAKLTEGSGALRFTTDTLRSLGPFYDLAEEIVDCSHGEPFLNPHLTNLIQRFVQSGKRFEMTTNGQLLGPRNRAKITDQLLTLYVSIDSASAQGYSLYRNDRFEKVVNNLRILCKEKKQHGDKLRVIVSYIVMPSNIGDLVSFIELMASVGVDGVKLRRLFSQPKMTPRSVMRNGVVFAYENQILDLRSFTDAVHLAEQVSRAASLTVTSELDFITNNVGLGTTLCREPWETIYVLHRGIHVCCFSKDPITYWPWRNGEPGDAFLREVWNGPEYRRLRSSLARGELHPSCFDRPSCPIVAQTRDVQL